MYMTSAVARSASCVLLRVRQMHCSSAMISKLVKKLNYLPEKPEPKPTPEQIAKMEAEKQAKIEAAKAAAAAKKAATQGDAAAGRPAAKDPAATDDKAAKALAAAGGDPEKEAKIKAALEKAAKLKAEREAAKAGGDAAK